MLKILAFLCVFLLEGLYEVSCAEGKTYSDFFFYSRQDNVNVTYMMMPDDNGIVVSAVLGGVVLNWKVEDESVDFLLWTRRNKHEPERIRYNINTTDGFNFANFNPLSKTMILIHGFKDQYIESEFFKIMRKVLLRYDDYNVIGVDWSKLSRIPWYAEAVKNSEFAGTLTAKAIEHMRRLYQNENLYIHIITYNLGALVAQAATRILEKKIDRITGLDPPYILTNTLPASRRLNRESAYLVEMIHTSGNYLGEIEPSGHRDFYPNGGVFPQPGCEFDVADRCSPRLAYFIYAEALLLRHNFHATQCSDYEAYLEEKCTLDTKIRLFNDAPPSYEGKFYFKTHSSHPLSKTRKQKSNLELFEEDAIPEAE